ncbi:MAG: hypothetical protein ACKO37_05220 [Vampirovibrionales bacterium]
MSFTTHLLSAATHAGVISAANVMRKGVGSAYRVYDAATIPDASPSLRVVARRESIVLGVTFVTNMMMQLGIVPLKRKLGKWYAPVQLGFDMLSLVFSEAFSRRHTYKDVKQNHIKPTIPNVPLPVTLPNVALPNLQPFPKSIMMSSVVLAGNNLAVLPPSNKTTPLQPVQHSKKLQSIPAVPQATLPSFHVAANTTTEALSHSFHNVSPIHLGIQTENPFQVLQTSAKAQLPQKLSTYEIALIRTFGASQPLQHA